MYSMNSKKASFKATSLLLALLLCFSPILTPALATTSNVFGSVLPTSDIGENFTPTDAMADSDIQELTDTSTVLD